MTEIDILRAALEWRRDGHKVAICTVVETRGSAPKPVGSHLVVADGGAFSGSVSAGCVEGDVITEAMDVMQSGRPRLLEFGVADELAWKAGLTCGGEIMIYVERLDAALAACLARVAGGQTPLQPSVLITPLDGGAPKLIDLGQRAAHPLAVHLDEVARTGRSRLAADGQRRCLLTAFFPPTRIIVIGAVHIAQALASAAALANLRIMVIDPRSAFATAERFPGVHVIADWPADVMTTIGLARSDAVAVLSHDPKIDDGALRLALDAGCFYVGALGSRRSHGRRLDRLRSAGVCEADLRRIHGPIGLDIGAEGPAEIAISIIADIISARRSRQSAAATREAA